MAALIDEAREARREAQRLRIETVELKLSCRERSAAARESLATAGEAAARIRARQAEALPSPWSTLDWIYDDRALYNVLVPVS